MEENPLHQFELHAGSRSRSMDWTCPSIRPLIFMWIVVAEAAVLMVMAGSSRKLVPASSRAWRRRACISFVP